MNPQEQNISSEGGSLFWRRNLIVIWFTQVLALMSFGFGLPFLPFYAQSLGVNDPDQLKLVSGILSMGPAISMAISSPLWGKLADRYGRKLMVIRAMLGGAVILAAMGLAPNVGVLILLRTVQGFFSGTIVAANTFVAAYTPKQHLSTSIGFLASANFIGFSLGPAMGGYVASALGYRVSFITGGVICFLGAILAWILIKEPKIVHNNRDGGKEIAEEKFGMREAMQAAGFVMIILLLQRFSRSIITPFIPLHLEELHGKDGILQVTGNFNMAVSLATAAAGLLLTQLGNRFGKFRFSVLLLALSCTCLLGIILNPRFWPFVILYVLTAFFLGGVEPILTAVIAERVEPEHRGAIFGYNALLSNIGWILAPLVGSALSIAKGISANFYAMLTTQLMCLVFIYISRQRNQE
jgi:DHA1 family multidrug resistance protein-like MFS transporter